MEKKLLVDTFIFKPELAESRGDKYVARGEFARANVSTANGRVYKNHIWEREIKKSQKLINERRMFGQLDHPKDGKSELSKASHIITELSFDGSRVYGELEILKTPAGDVLKGLVDSGCSIGVSSRGFGSTKRNSSGSEVVQDDYNLVTFDCVGDPANATSWPKFQKEEKDNSLDRKIFDENLEEEMNFEELKKKYPSLVEEIGKKAILTFKENELNESKMREQVKEDVKKQMKDEFVSLLKDQREKIKEEIESKYKSDPETAGAKTVLESVAKHLRPYMLSEDADTLLKEKEEIIESKDNEIFSLRENNQNMEQALYKMACVAESLGFNAYLEKTLGKLNEENDREKIRSMVGDVGKYECMEDFKNALIGALKALKEDKTKNEGFNKEIARLQRENEKLREATEKSLNVANKLAIQAYVSEKIGYDPRAKKFKDIIENEDLSSREDVDERIAQLKNEYPLSKEYREVDESLNFRRGKDDGGDFLAEGRMSSNRGSSVLGADMSELRQLSGIK